MPASVPTSVDATDISSLIERHYLTASVAYVELNFSAKGLRSSEAPFLARALDEGVCGWHLLNRHKGVPQGVVYGQTPRNPVTGRAFRSVSLRLTKTGFDIFAKDLYMLYLASVSPRAKEGRKYGNIVTYDDFYKEIKKECLPDNPDVVPYKEHREHYKEHTNVEHIEQSENKIGQSPARSQFKMK